MEKLLTAQEVAAILGVHPNRIWADAKAGRIPSIRIGRTVRFRLPDIERWLDGSTQDAA